MNWLRRVMYGRYGSDQLSVFLIAIYVVLAFVAMITRLSFLSWIGLVFLIIAFFRIFSRNIPHRRAENMRFMNFAAPLIRWLKMRRTIARDKEHRYFRCPNCGQCLRVPRGKGKVTITCRSCGISFEENS
ncbi:MAG: hypothetical protein LUG13_09935 [Oscillospiraceae bacterium]|nr:hypothetical protein [Oscillospiraceae bacterium]